MLTKRLIGIILCNEASIVQSVQFKHTNVIGNLKTGIDYFSKWSVDEIILLDVTRYKSSQYLIKFLPEIVNKCFCPITVGGHIDSIEKGKELISNGADKILLNTRALLNPYLIKSLANKLGSQAIVCGIDIKKGKVYTCQGEIKQKIDPIQLASYYESSGCGEIFLQSIDRDGMGNGYDLHLIKKMSKIINVPLIVAGGVGIWQHLVEGINSGANGVCVANKFHFEEQSAYKAKQYMNNKKINVRIEPLDIINQNENISI